jgi:large subunit ribosomal protein L1
MATDTTKGQGKLTKRQKQVAGKVDSTKLYPLDNALALVKECATAKFDESIDVAVQLGIDAKKSDQVVRGAVVMPSGTGKTKRVAVFAQGAKAEEARAAGADLVGMDDLAAEIKGGKMDFDVVIASPDTMRVVGTLGQILGPRGLMPNPKSGTVTFDVARAVKELKAGKIEFRVDKGANVHAPVGKASFTEDRLLENTRAFLRELMRAKPTAAKGTYIKSMTLSSTMGPGIDLDPTAVTADVSH